MVRFGEQPCRSVGELSAIPLGAEESAAPSSVTFWSTWTRVWFTVGNGSPAAGVVRGGEQQIERQKFRVPLREVERLRQKMPT